MDRAFCPSRSPEKGPIVAWPRESLEVPASPLRAAAPASLNRACPRLDRARGIKMIRHRATCIRSRAYRCQPGAEERLACQHKKSFLSRPAPCASASTRTSVQRRDSQHSTVSGKNHCSQGWWSDKGCRRRSLSMIRILPPGRTTRQSSSTARSGNSECSSDSTAKTPSNSPSQAGMRNRLPCRRSMSGGSRLSIAGDGSMPTNVEL